MTITHGFELIREEKIVELNTMARLYSHVDEPVLAMNARDMRRRDLLDGDIVRVKSRRGEMVTRAAASDEMRAGQTFLPMHWGSQFMNSGGANALTISAFDPISKQPELKHAAIHVEKLELPWQLVVMRCVGQGGAMPLMARAQPLLSEFTFATIGLFGRDQPAVILRAAHQRSIGDSVIEEIDRVFEFDAACSLIYMDARRGISKRVMVEENRVTAARLTGETAARDWLKDIMAQGVSADAVRRWVLAPLSEPPAGSSNRGRIICNCLDVAEQEIRAEFAHGSDLATLQRKLKCGTDCGSCVPELKRLFAVQRQQAA